MLTRLTMNRSAGREIMQRILLTVFVFSILSITCVNNSYSMAQISMQNNTSLWLNLYIDGNFGCGPVMPNGFCTSSVNAGPHVLEARKGQEVVATEKGVNIGDGTSPTWTVSLEDPARELTKRLNGARFSKRDENQWMHTEDELVIEGGTLVWMNRITWASPEVAKAIRSGTGGFRHQTIGSWLEFERLKIIGREARLRRVFRNGKVAEYTFIISEDGNTITQKGTTQEGGTVAFVFYRRQ